MLNLAINFGIRLELPADALMAREALANAREAALQAQRGWFGVYMVEFSLLSLLNCPSYFISATIGGLCAASFDLLEWARHLLQQWINFGKSLICLILGTGLLAMIILSEMERDYSYIVDVLPPSPSLNLLDDVLKEGHVDYVSMRQITPRLIPYLYHRCPDEIQEWLQGEFPTLINTMLQDMYTELDNFDAFRKDRFSPLCRNWLEKLLWGPLRGNLQCDLPSRRPCPPIDLLHDINHNLHPSLLDQSLKKLLKEALQEELQKELVTLRQDLFRELRASLITDPYNQMKDHLQNLLQDHLQNLFHARLKKTLPNIVIRLSKENRILRSFPQDSFLFWIHGLIQDEFQSICRCLFSNDAFLSIIRRDKIQVLLSQKFKEYWQKCRESGVRPQREWNSITFQNLRKDLLQDLFQDLLQERFLNSDLLSQLLQKLQPEHLQGRTLNDCQGQFLNQFSDSLHRWLLLIMRKF